jgi:Mrp family chromosome partitioning ATPase
MMSVPTFLKSNAKAESKANQGRTRSVFEWLREGKGAQAGSGNPLVDTLPIHTDWLFSTCEPRMADLVHRVDVRLSGRPQRVLQFIGVDRGVGASTVAFAYASASAALRQRRVLLLSADEGRAAPGVLACVSEGRRVSDAVSTLHGTLSYGTLTRDGSSDRDAQMLMADRAVWRKICEEFYEVVVDCRSIDASLGALTIAPRADGVVVVIQSGRTRVASGQELLNALVDVKAPVVGAVLNKGTADAPFGSRGDDE